MDKKLETFKIGEKHKPRITKSVTAESAHAQETSTEKETLGFARIEAILDEESPEEVSRQLTLRLEALAEYESHAHSPKEKAAAKRGRIAIERTADLLGYLFQTKAALMPPEAPEGKGSRKKSAKGRANPK